MRHGQRRVTLDLDDADPIDASRAYHGLMDAGAGDVEIRVSSSGEGFHVRAWFDRGELEDDGVERLRRLFGDDERRIELDRTHNIKPDQMLFTSKPNRDASAGPWHTDPFAAGDELRKRSDRFGYSGWSPV